MKGIYNKIRELCRSANIPEGKITDEYLFTINSVDVFYYKKNIGTIDISSGFTDGSNDGGIDFIYGDDDVMYLVQGKSTENLSIDDIKNVFNKILETVEKMERDETKNYSKKLVTIYKNTYENLSDEKNIKFVLFTETTLNDKAKQQIQEFSSQEKFANYEIVVYDKTEIIERDNLLFQESDLIENDKIQMYGDAKNYLKYGDNGVIINIKATSLKNLFIKHAEKGLFSYNLREHISQKNVDDAIEKTIIEEKENFWFYNNGVTIGCEDFDIDGNTVKLYNFSIINGAQTTTKIGESGNVDKDNDFAIVCKIVKSNKKGTLDNDFISKISEASNSQKPIKHRDIKANNKEQKLLQAGCAKNGKYTLAVEIKRGVKPKNVKKVDKWQRVTNEFLGQLIYSCILQYPGSSRNNKTLLFSTPKMYNAIFNRKHDYNTLYDLVKMSDLYDSFAEKYTSSLKPDDDDYLDNIGILKNGKLYTLAICCYLCKKKREIVFSYEDIGLNKDNLNGLLITDYPNDDLDTKIYELYKFIIRELLRFYKFNRTALKITNHSNLFKSDEHYLKVISGFDKLDTWDQEKLDTYLSVFTIKRHD